MSFADRLPAAVNGVTCTPSAAGHDDPAYCLSGPDGSGVAMAIDPVSEVPADGITLDTRGSGGNGSARFNYLVGSMGAGVKEITVRNHGHTVHATLEVLRSSLPYGRWTAWWPGGGPTATGTTLTVTFRDGTIRTVDAASVTK